MTSLEMLSLMKILFFRSGRRSLKISSTEHNEQFDDQFYQDILNEKLFLEDRMLDPLFEENPSLNISIIRLEVEKVVYSAKMVKV